MKYCKHTVSLFCLILSFGVSAKDTVSAQNRLPEIFTNSSSGEWKDASAVDVEAVALSVVSVLMRDFPEKIVAPIILQNHESGPIVLFEKGPHNEFIVRVDIDGRKWSQLSYQFSHEYCHILSNYANEAGSNQWFEEALCEAISLYALEKMTAEWKHNPPYANWKSYASSLQKYLDNALAEKHRYSKKTLSAWYQDNKKAIRNNAGLRKKEEVVGTAIYQLIKAGAFDVSTIQYLNLGVRDNEKILSVYFKEWFDHSPLKNKASVRNLATLFHIVI